MTAEPLKPLGDVGRIADFAELAVAHDVDARLCLAYYGVVDRSLHDAFEFIGMDGFPMVARKQQ